MTVVDAAVALSGMATTTTDFVSTRGVVIVSDLLITIWVFTSFDSALTGAMGLTFSTFSLTAVAATLRFSEDFSEELFCGFLGSEMIGTRTENLQQTINYYLNHKP